MRSNLEMANNEESPGKQEGKLDGKTDSSLAKSSKTTFLSGSLRLDLSRPLNFYPAPNTYKHVDFLSERKFIPSPGRIIAGHSKKGSQVDSI